MAPPNAPNNASKTDTPVAEEPVADEPDHLVLALAGIAVIIFIVLRKGRRNE
jgi:hypothetical protein